MESLGDCKRFKKEPFVPREYQIELYSQALERNTIAVMETGAGKTLIAVMLIKEMVTRQHQLYKSDPKTTHKVAIFLVNTVPLVFQQGELVKSCIPYKVELICGQMNSEMWKIDGWRKRIDSNDVLVLTAQVFLNILRHGFISLNETILLVFDECHHSRKNHPYNLIMYEFYHQLPLVTKENLFVRPKIFGMTASPLNSRKNSTNTIINLEATMDAGIFIPSLQRELKEFTSKPVDKIQEYDLPSDCYKINPLVTLIYERFSESHTIKNLYKSYKDVLAQLGPWCALLMFRNALDELDDKDSLYTNFLLEYKFTPTALTSESLYIKQACTFLKNHINNELNSTNILDMDPFTLTLDQLSPKTLILLKTLYSFNNKKPLCCIIFVERRCIAHALMHLIKSSKSLSFIKPDCLLGHGNRQAMHNIRMNINQQKNVMMDFKSETINLMIATQVAEEGLDIQPCNVVIRFDFCHSLISYIQSRGRARQKESDYILFLEKGNNAQHSIIKVLQCGEKDMVNNYTQIHKNQFNSSILDKKETSLINTELKKMKIYRIPKTGATLTFDSSIELLHRFCLNIPQSYCRTLPHFEFFKIGQSFKCTLTLPSNSPLKEVKGELARSKLLASQYCAFEACKYFHSIGALDDNLLPPLDLFDANNFDVIRKNTIDGRDDSYQAKKEYQYKVPDFWQDELRWDKLFLNIIDVSNINMSLNDRLYSPLAIITKKPLPKFNDIEIFLKGTTPKVKIIVSTEPFKFVSPDKIQKLYNFTKKAFSELFHKEIFCNLVNISYLLAPLKLISYEMEVKIESIEIDWNKVDHCIKPSISFDKTFNDLIIYDPNLSIRYYVLTVHNDLNPLSEFPINEKLNISNENRIMSFEEFYLKKLKRKVTNFIQPVLEVQKIVTLLNYLNEYLNSTQGRPTEFVLPEFYKSYCFHASTWRSLMLIPSLMLRIDALLLMKEVKCKMNMPEVSDELLLEAFTFETANVNMNYERLEFLGDSFLKFVATLDVFISFPLKQECQLHCQRIELISNDVMYRAARERNLPEYFITQPFNRRIWRPHNMKFDGDCFNSKENTHKIHKRALTNKALADVVEASLGASLLSAGYQGALKCAVAFGIPIKKILNWEELSHLSPNNNSKCDEITQKKIIDVSAIEKIIGYKFLNKTLLIEAFTHASFIYVITPNYQRLEFLGDAILDYFIVSYIFYKYPDMKPGSLTEMKEVCAKNNTLAVVMEGLGLHHYILHSSKSLNQAINEFIMDIVIKHKQHSNHQSTKIKQDFWFNIDAPKVISDVLEAIVGAVYVDSKFSIEITHKLFERLIQPFYDQHVAPHNMNLHFNSNFCKVIQKYGCKKLNFNNDILEINSITKGDPKNQVTCTVTLHGVKLCGESGASIKLAKEKACRNLIINYNENLSIIENLCDCPSRKIR